MWAGGSLRFTANGLQLDNTRASCTESISNVAVKGSEGEEKVFVTIQREIRILSDAGPSSLDFDNTEAGSSWPSINMLEERNLVFMRQKSAADAKADAAKPGKVLKRMRRFSTSISSILTSN